MMSIKGRLLELIGIANAKTGKTDTTVASAIASLCDGYGHGGGDIPPSDVEDIDPVDGVSWESVTINGSAQQTGAYFKIFPIDYSLKGDWLQLARRIHGADNANGRIVGLLAYHTELGWNPKKARAVCCNGSGGYKFVEIVDYGTVEASGSVVEGDVYERITIPIH